MTDEFYMRLAIQKARTGIAAGQLPVGAVLVRSGAVVCAVHNTVWRDLDPTAHGEMNAVRQSARSLGTIDLSGSTVYVTLEPCPMCLGALHWARVARVVFGGTIADSAAAGFSELAVPARELAQLGHSPIQVEPGSLRDECVALFDEWRKAGKSTVY